MEPKMTLIEGTNQSGRELEFVWTGVEIDDVIGGENTGNSFSKVAPTIPIACKAFGLKDHKTPRLFMNF
jgi:hypothetical protein